MEMKKEIFVTVAGHTASGKTRATLEIKRLFQELGFEVEVKPTVDYTNIDTYMSRLVNDKESAFSMMRTMAETRKIIIEEKQLARK